VVTNFSHCHIDWHIISGMVAQFIEAPLEIQKRISVPEITLQQCAMAGIPVSGPAEDEGQVDTVW
jgi:iron transport multicopper oxidase